MKILVTDGMDKGAQEKLVALGHTVDNQFYEPDTLGKALRDYDVVIIRSKTKIRAAQIDEAKGSQLKCIIRAGVGVDNIDVKYAEANGIAVKNTPRASSQSVAELALAHLFSCARFISIAGATMRQGAWEKKAYSAGVELCGKTLGIVGFGRIGQKLCQMAKGIGMTVVAYDAFPVAENEKTFGVKYVALDALLAQSDFVSLHAPSAEKPIIDADAIAKMKDGAILVNTSRGSNVDESALLAALDSGKILAAGLDVFAEEPAKNEALYCHPHVSCTPHIGAGTQEAQARIGAEIVELITAL